MLDQINELKNVISLHESAKSEDPKRNQAAICQDQELSDKLSEAQAELSAERVKRLKEVQMLKYRNIQLTVEKSELSAERVERLREVQELKYRNTQLAVGKSQMIKEISELKKYKELTSGSIAQRDKQIEELMMLVQLNEKDNQFQQQLSTLNMKTFQTQQLSTLNMKISLTQLLSTCNIKNSQTQQLSTLNIKNSQTMKKEDQMTKTIKTEVFVRKTEFKHNRQFKTFDSPKMELLQSQPFDQFNPITTIQHTSWGYWQFINAKGEKVNEHNDCYNNEIENWIDLGSHQVTQIKVTYKIGFGELKALVFYSGQKKIARIGETIIYPGFATKMIELQEGEKWIGVSSSSEYGKMTQFQLITARLE